MRWVVTAYVLESVELSFVFVLCVQVFGMCGFLSFLCCPMCFLFLNEQPYTLSNKGSARAWCRYVGVRIFKTFAKPKDFVEIASDFCNQQLLHWMYRRACVFVGSLFVFGIAPAEAAEDAEFKRDAEKRQPAGPVSPGLSRALAPAQTMDAGCYSERL